MTLWHIFSFALGGMVASIISYKITTHQLRSRRCTYCGRRWHCWYSLCPPCRDEHEHWNWRKP